MALVGNDEKVKEDVDCGSRPALRIDIVAGAFMFTISPFPWKWNRLALENRYKGEGDDVPDTASHNFVYHSSKISFWKYAKIEEEDGEFYQS